jgi:hypothetical protein
MKGKAIVCLVALAILAAAPMAWPDDGDNYFLYSYGPANDDPLADNNTRDVNAGSDVDQDGLYEIMVTDHDDGGRVHVYEVVDDDNLQWVWSSAGTNLAGDVTCRAVHTGDMDNDGVGEIIFLVCDGFTDTTTYEAGLHVYEWDGVTDNGYGVAPVSVYNPDTTTGERFRAEDFDMGDVDGDGKNELLVPNNPVTNDKEGCFILSVDGSFQGAYSWVEEAAYYRTSPDAWGGSPLNAHIADMDGDGLNEAIFGIWDYCAFWIVEATDTNTYVYQTYIQTDPNDDGAPLIDFGIADLNNDGGDEIYVNMYNDGELAVITGGTDVSLITPASNLFFIDSGAGGGNWGVVAIGDQDHGTGSDGPDLYVTDWNATGDVYDYELSGTDPTNPANWTKYTIIDDYSGSGVPVPITAPPVDMDADGKLELVVGYGDGVPSDRNWFRIFEWSEFPPHDLGVVALTSYTTMGAGSIDATIGNFGNNDETGFEVYWKVDNGDSSSDTFTGTLDRQTEDDLALSWDIPDTIGLYSMTAWTALPADTNTSNDSLTQKIYSYPPTSGQYTYSYRTVSATQTRGIGVFGRDDYVVGITQPTFQLEYYHNAPNPPDVIVTEWSDGDTTIALYYNWGIGLDADNNVYLANQNPDSTAEILVWDYDGDEVDWFDLGYSDKKIGPDGNDEVTHEELMAMIAKGEVKGTTYPSAVDVDENGYIYVAWYVEDGTIHDQIEVYSPIDTWVNHQATKQGGFEPGAYVVEGLCVNADGSVMWITNRSAPGSLGDVTRWTGGPTLGYTQDITFSVDGTADIPGYVRGIDLGPDGKVYVCSDADNIFDTEKVFIVDGTTGELESVIDINSPGAAHDSPYDIEFSVSGEVDLTIQKAEDDAYLSWSVPTSTAFYVTHKAGYRVAKWQGPGAKDVTGYEVYRDTLTDFLPSAATLLDTTSNSYYLDELSGVGDTGLNYYYIVKAMGTPGYTSKSAIVGEFDRDLQKTKKGSLADRPDRELIIRKRPEGNRKQDSRRIINDAKSPAVPKAQRPENRKGR